MNYIKFEWDEKKNKTNQQKHGVSFQEAQSVFNDENARLIADKEHSQDDDRFILLGLSYSLKMLVVVHAYRETDDIIRILSARKATKNETMYYNRRR